jgi:hypothetical protein
VPCWILVRGVSSCSRNASRAPFDTAVARLSAPSTSINFSSASPRNRCTRAVIDSNAIRSELNRFARNAARNSWSAASEVSSAVRHSANAEASIGRTPAEYGGPSAPVRTSLWDTGLSKLALWPRSGRLSSLPYSGFWPETALPTRSDLGQQSTRTGGHTKEPPERPRRGSAHRNAPA